MFRRDGRRLTCLSTRRGLGFTLHRAGGLSVIGVPREGGSSILWGPVGDRVERGARQLRYRRRVGSVGIYVGADF